MSILWLLTAVGLILPRDAGGAELGHGAALEEDALVVVASAYGGGEKRPELALGDAVALVLAADSVVAGVIVDVDDVVPRHRARLVAVDAVNDGRLLAACGRIDFDLSYLF